MSPDDLREVRFDSLLSIGELIGRFTLTDVPKEDVLAFIDSLTMRRDAWFVETGVVGLLYLTGIRPGRGASFHAVFWDQGLGPDRLAAAKMFVGDAFVRFDLPRLSADVPVQNLPMKRFLRDIGFVLEGVTRLGWSVDPPIDSVHFGMLREERPISLPFSTSNGG